ncbi:MAG: LacI family DNA-binding transcriptional regulator [Chloroflexia bacterium]|nr:LacI family DNA-binding transcriptional regulator [Chloroflexia bacterium]
MPTLKQIARHARTSVTTVSLVLNGRDGEHRISAATTRQVQESARLLGYTPNLVARRLRSATGPPPLTIGMLLPEDERLTITVRAVGTIRETLDAWAAERGLESPDLLIETFQGGRLAEIRSLRSNARYNGAIIFSTFPEDDRYLGESGPLAVPLVLVQRSVEGHGWVNVDNHQVGGRVADHLLGLGHERFGVVAADVPGAALDDRRDGFLARLRERAGIVVPEERIVHGAFSEAGGAAATERVLGAAGAELAAFPSALYVTADLMAVGVLHALKRGGLRVPADVSVVGTDNDPYAAFMDPPLTTVDIARTESAQLATRALLDRVSGLVTGPETHRLDSRLIDRASAATVGRADTETC